jgi:hypothetical protein
MSAFASTVSGNGRAGSGQLEPTFIAELFQVAV